MSCGRSARSGSPVAARRKRIEPAHLWVPDHTSSAGQEAVDLAADAGLILDAEQQLAVEVVLSEQGSKWAALEAAIVEARQNGKTVDLQAIVLAGLYLFGEELITWSAHLFPTTQEAFRDLTGLIDGRAWLSRRVKRISYANGEEAIELLGGQRVLFKARTKTGGRGLSGDRVILDEAWALGAHELGSLFPTLSARENPQAVYASSAGLVDSAHLRTIRDRGRRGGDPSLVYIEWCAPKKDCKAAECEHRVGTPGCVLDDKKLWQQANPTLGRRITVAYVVAERRALPLRSSLVSGSGGGTRTTVMTPESRSRCGTSAGDRRRSSPTRWSSPWTRHRTMPRRRSSPAAAPSRSSNTATEHRGSSND